MEAIKRIIALEEAETIEEMDTAMMEAHHIINAMHEAKLHELETKVAHRLGINSALANVSAVKADRNEDELPKVRRPVRDEPQA